MGIHLSTYHSILAAAAKAGATLVAVSKLQPDDAIMSLYEEGHRDFGENYIQELTGKQSRLPKDIRWHFIGHLQSNKVKYIAPFIHLIHGVDSLSALKEISKQFAKVNRIGNVLLQVHIAAEITKSGLTFDELQHWIEELQADPLPSVCIRGLMGMATFTDNQQQIAGEFHALSACFEKYKSQVFETNGFKWDTLSMGMTADYEIALQHGSNMIRVGSAIFGERNN